MACVSGGLPLGVLRSESGLRPVCAALGWANRVDSRADTCEGRGDCGECDPCGWIAFEARGPEGLGSRQPGGGRVGMLVAVALLAGVALVAAVVDTSGCAAPVGAVRVAWVW